ncbi:hypothetical protein Q8F55_000707 [Vanrija albida]|uniref:Uncharacterized protein n=1 Tax=Vanrija albida TaxID=181172 RepID=A0ABR3QE15_9TREE
MATATRPLRVLARALHTSRLVAEEAKSVPKAKAKAAATAESLGFSTKKRERALPALSVPASARGNIGRGASAGSDGAERSARQPREDRPRGDRQQGERAPREPRQQADGAPRQRREQGDRPPRERREQGDRPPRERREQGDRPPRERREQGDRPPRREQGERIHNTAPRNEGERRARERRKTETRKPKHAEAADASGIDAIDAIDAIPLEFFEGAELAPAVKTAPRPRTERAPRPDRKKPAVKAGSVQLPFHMPVVKRETTAVALFGKHSILDRVPPGARDPASSFWAKGMSAAEAHQADVLRRAGSYATRVAPRPQAFGGLKNAGATATWALSLNPSVSQRRAQQAAEVVAKLTQ